jgi:excisionase family DNA binding protein
MTITDPRPDQLPELLTTKQVAERLHMSQAWVRLKIATGELPVVRLGRRTLFDVRDVQALIERSKGE